MRKVAMWLFSKTKLGRFIDGNKRIVGFAMWLLGYIIQGLSISAQFFPQVGLLAETASALKSLNDSLSEWLKAAGVSVMMVGVWHAAEKEKGANKE